MENQHLARKLKRRHVQMIALGGAIGTGLFLGSGTAIQQAGPSILLAYAIGGFFCYLMMRALGELLLSNTRLHSFLEFVNLYLGKRFEFGIGWTYWLCWISLAMADLTASGIYIRYWFPTVPQWVPPLVIILILLAFNLLSVSAFGELEYWFSMIKVVAIVALIVTGAILIGSAANVGGHTVSMSNLVTYGGFFPKGFGGFLGAFSLVIFAFTGIEMVGITAGEAENPVKELPRAINSLPLRISFFYVGALFVIMSIYPWQQITADQSPFVQVFSDIGVKAAASIINFVVLTAALSACNSAIFSTSRTLFTLAHSDNAPKWMGKVNRYNVPARALGFSSLVLLLIVVLNFVMPSTVFTLISNVATTNFIIVWVALLACHLVYKRTTNSADNPFKMPLFPLSSWATILFFLAVTVILCFDPVNRWAVIGSVIWFVGLLVIERLMRRHQAAA
ncbi:MAG TPA: amino acid permease [Candidatus Levilactobacillus faecigallinarum]|uniref:Amino acid permease n=1 Tax=Candidatus Levilactobacillus faecigallinarum TaxID=2838638 RepID=A0A9D1U5D1_9LACO|nr:amino acid permease [Candidatus Levilactobacillus faecigallinarum]